MTAAICLKCGQSKSDFDVICPHCGHRPFGDGLLMAWLVSSHHLSPAQLEAAAQRIRSGKDLNPSEALLETARQALGRAASQDPGLPTAQRLALLLTSVIFTPWPGLVLWFWWRKERPKTAKQSLWLSLPAGLLWFAVVLSPRHFGLGLGL